MVDTNGSTTPQQDAPLNHKGDEEAQLNHHGTTGNSPTPPSRPPLRALIQDFSPVWFTWCMNTGILSSLMYTLPYSFPGLHTIATILFLIDLILFILFSVLFSLRLYLHYPTAWNEISSDVNELCFTATLPISWMTLTTLTSIIVSNASWAGEAFTLLAYVMWWVGAAWTTLFGIATYAILTQKQLTSANNLSLAIILPAVATSTAAAEGGLICIHSPDLSARLAVPVIIVSFMLLGVGVLIGMLIYGLFLQRMLGTGWFDGVRRPSLMLLLGPTGQSATALLALSLASLAHFPNYHHSSSPTPSLNPTSSTIPSFFTPSIALSLHAFTTSLALLLLGLATFYLLFALTGILHALMTRTAKWTPTWYSTIFPPATMNSALILLAEVFNSPTFRVLATIMLVCLTVNVIVQFGFTVRGLWRREVLIVRVDLRGKSEEKRS